MNVFKGVRAITYTLYKKPIDSYATVFCFNPERKRSENTHQCCIHLDRS